MNRMKIIIAGIVIFLLAAGAAIYIATNANKGAGDSKDIPAQGTKSTPEDSGLQDSDRTEPDTSSVETELQQTPEPLKTEEIKVSNNSPEYDLKMTLTEDGEKKSSLRLEYYYGGTGTVNTLDSTVIPEIDEIFEKRAEKAPEDKSYRVEKAYLNTKLAKVYFIVNGNGNAGVVQSDMYVFSLADAKAKKVFSNRGKYGGMLFSKDYKYLAYSYNDSEESSVLQESSLLEIIDCSKDDFIVKNSRIKDDKKIGSNMKPESVYDYSFIAWDSNNTVKLKQKPVLDEKAAETDVLYDILKNLILGMDGMAINPEKNAGAGKSEKPPAESDALKALKAFYTCLDSKNEYQKAMEFLDETFTIKLAIFKQFGISELSKSDISAEDADIYSDMLRAASFDIMVSEESKDKIVTIAYYQNMKLSEDNSVRQPMSAQIKKTEKGWKITLLQDADGSKPPFASTQQ